MDPTTYALGQINKCFENASKELWKRKTIEEVDNLDKTKEKGKHEMKAGCARVYRGEFGQ